MYRKCLDAIDASTKILIGVAGRETAVELHELAARRAARALSLLIEFVDACQVMPLKFLNLEHNFNLGVDANDNVNVTSKVCSPSVKLCFNPIVNLHFSILVLAFIQYQFPQNFKTWQTCAVVLKYISALCCNLR